MDSLRWTACSAASLATRGVGELLPPVDAVTAATLLMKPLLQVTNFDSVTQAQIDTALDHVRATPELQPALTALNLTTGTDTAGMRITVATVRLRNTGDEAVEDAQLAINDLAEAAEGTLSVRSVSLAVIEEEYQEATSTGGAAAGGAGAARDRVTDAALHAHAL